MKKADVSQTERTVGVSLPEIQVRGIIAGFDRQIEDLNRRLAEVEAAKEPYIAALEKSE